MEIRTITNSLQYILVVTFMDDIGYGTCYVPCAFGDELLNLWSLSAVQNLV